jgi:FAD:protein FMN transferase
MMRSRRLGWKQRDNVHFDAIGTRWQIDIPETYSEHVRAQALEHVFARIAVFDKDYSRFREDSLVMEMARRSGTYPLPPDAQPMFDLYRDLYALTDGAFTPLIGQTLVDAGYDARYSLKPGTLSAPPSWDKAMTYSYPTLTLYTPALLDVGAAGKGYLVDIVGELLVNEGIRSFCVDAGGDMLYKSEVLEPLRVGLENPQNTSQVIGIAEITRGSICGSAGNRRAWKGFHHTIDPRTQKSPDHILATWVTADTALLADALATCLFLTSPEKLHAVYDFSHCMLYPDMTVGTSPHFPAEFFTG